MELRPILRIRILDVDKKDLPTTSLIYLYTQSQTACLRVVCEQKSQLIDLEVLADLVYRFEHFLHELDWKFQLFLGPKRTLKCILLKQTMHTLHTMQECTFCIQAYSLQKTSQLDISIMSTAATITLQFHGSVLRPDLLTFLLTEMEFKNISPHGEILI